MTGRDPFDGLIYELTGPGGMVIGVPAFVLAILYAEKEFVGKRPLKTDDNTLLKVEASFEGDSNALFAWARENCSWRDVCSGSVIIKDMDEHFYEGLWRTSRVSQSRINWT